MEKIGASKVKIGASTVKVGAARRIAPLVSGCRFFLALGYNLHTTQ